MYGNDKKSLGIYVHIPFCVKKCLYCDFVSMPDRRDGLTKSYVDALLAEVAGYRGKFGCKDTEYVVKTVYIGGGTPSILAPFFIVRILERIKEVFDVCADAEITIEANPGTLDADRLKIYREAGINRLSIGLQSADDNELKALGRIHDLDDFMKAYEAATAAGFDNISVDVMTAIPYQTMDSLRVTLDTITGLDPAPKHISAYSLILEEGTPFYEMYKEKKDMKTEEPSPCLHVQLPDEDMERAMYHFTVDHLKERGYERYEISNFSKPGFESRHNTAYWRRRDYIGFGLAAASCVNGVRYQNTVRIDEYINGPYLDDRFEEVTVLKPEDEMSEFMFLGLRMCEGVRAGDFFREFDKELTDVYGREIQRLVKEGLLAHDGALDRYYLTDKGIDYGNYAFSQFV